jgi:hypothetical protein
VLVHVWQESAPTLVIGPIGIDNSHAANPPLENRTARPQADNAAKVSANNNAQSADVWKEARHELHEAGHALVHAILESDPDQYDPESGSPNIILGKQRWWGLFIAYGEHGWVTAHKTSKTAVDPACLQRNAPAGTISGPESTRQIPVGNKPIPPRRKPRPNQRACQRSNGIKPVVVVAVSDS